MGSSGSGRLTDYPGSGRPAADDRCTKAFKEALQDIEHCDYFKTHGRCPPVGTELRIAQKKRIVAETTSGEVVGNISTSRNYLAECLKDGFSYVGKVIESNADPSSAVVVVDFGVVQSE